MVGGASVVLAFAFGEHSPAIVTPSFFDDIFALLITMSSLLTLAGGAALVVASMSSPWLPGRRRVKLVLLSVTAVVWAVGFILLITPGLVELP